MNMESSEDEPDTTEVYFPREYKLLTSDDLVIGHNYYVIDSNKKGKHILYKRPNQNYSSGPFIYYGKYIESYIQPKMLPDVNDNNIIFINIYKFYDNDETFSNKIKYTKDNFDKKNVEMFRITNVSTYKHTFLYLDADSVVEEPPPLVKNVNIINKSARNIPIRRGTKSIPVANMLTHTDDEELPAYSRVRRYFGGKKKKGKTIRKNKKMRKKHTRCNMIHH